MAPTGTEKMRACLNDYGPAKRAINRSGFSKLENAYPASNCANRRMLAKPPGGTLMRRILWSLLATAAMLVQLVGWSTSRVDADAGARAGGNTRGFCAANQKALDSFQKVLRF